MLLQFRFQNFKCFRDDTILDMTAAPHVTEHPDHVAELGEERVLPAAAIYGANASGKSKVVEALSFMRQAVSLAVLPPSLIIERHPMFWPTDPDPFLFDQESRSASTTFEIYFTLPEEQDSTVWNYGFSLNDSNVLEEWLNEKNAGDTEFHSVFYREGMELDMPGIPEKWQESLRISLPRGRLLLSLGSFLIVEKLSKIAGWFARFSFADPKSAYDDMHIQYLAFRMANHKLARRDVVKYLSAFDPSIADFQIERIPNEGGKGNPYRIWAKHRIAGSDKLRNIPLSQESDGTQKMLSLYLLLTHTLARGSILVIDELNAKLHPLLVRNILLMFLNPETNPKHAQILFTTHDVWQLTSGLLRRDEIWFTQKNPDGACTLYSRSDFIDGDGDHFLREDMAEAYLTGEYGAIPHLRPLFRNADRARRTAKRKPQRTTAETLQRTEKPGRREHGKSKEKRE